MAVWDLTGEVRRLSGGGALMIGGGRGGGDVGCGLCRSSCVCCRGLCFVVVVVVFICFPNGCSLERRFIETKLRRNINIKKWSVHQALNFSQYKKKSWRCASSRFEQRYITYTLPKEL